jgi:hypothetical protein
VKFVFNSLTLLKFNEVGQTAFRTQLSGVGVNETNNIGIWAEGKNGLELVVRTGEFFEVSPGDLRIPNSLAIIGFNDHGQLAFLTDFLDGTSGIFVADVGIVPEPASAVLVIVAAMVVGACRRRG